MATVESAIPDLLFARLAALVLSPVLPVSYPGVKFTPPVGTYLQADFVPNANTNLFVGDGATVQHQGLLQVTVVAPEGQGAVKAHEIAGKVVAHFAKGLRLQAPEVTVRIEEKPSVAGALQDGDRLRVPVTVRYRAFV